MSDFYNGNKLLSLLDVNKRKPELYFCCGNRTAGKTFFFKRWMLRRFVKHGEKFVIFVRFKEDMPNRVNGFFADIGPIAFPGHHMTQKPILNGNAYELHFDGKPCGYVISLNTANRIKENSALFADAERGFLDEFMSETGKYVPQELQKFNSIRISIARGGAKGTHTRYFPVYLCSNNVTLFNPYFTYLMIAPKMSNRVRYLRGDGWVLEQTFNVAAADSIKREFRTIGGEELQYATENQYLLDKNQFIEKKPGMKVCSAKIKFNGKMYGVWTTLTSSEIYVSTKCDPACEFILAFTDVDHDVGSVLIAKNSKVFHWMKDMYSRGLVWFENGACRHAFITSLCIQ